MENGSSISGGADRNSHTDTNIELLSYAEESKSSLRGAAYTMPWDKGQSPKFQSPLFSLWLSGENNQSCVARHVILAAASGIDSYEGMQTNMKIEILHTASRRVYELKTNLL
jgi:hypothetical protein